MGLVGPIAVMDIAELKGEWGRESESAPLELIIQVQFSTERKRQRYRGRGYAHAIVTIVVSGCRVTILSQRSRAEWPTGYALIGGLALEGYLEENGWLRLIFLGLTRGDSFEVVSAKLSASDQVDFDCDKTTH